MRIVLLGATGNVGTSVLRALATDPAVQSILGVARRRPSEPWPKTEWHAADIRSADLADLFAGADAVIHLAWSIQPSRDQSTLHSTNVDGSRRVFEAVAAARVPALVYASSVGAYSPGPKDRLVDESWPTAGVATSFYSRHKAQVERLLDDFERENPHVRVARLRPGLIFKHEAASEIRRLFAGPFLPTRLVHPRRIPVVPSHPRLRFQAVHSLDVGEAYALASTRHVHGAFNIAADPVLDGPTLARILAAKPVRVPAGVLRGLAAASWRLRLQPTPEGWVDMALAVPLMDTTRARQELGWHPRHSARDALLELLEGIHDRDGIHTPPLEPDHPGGRLREVLSGVGGRDG